jgi:hypothetical protein
VLVAIHRGWDHQLTISLVVDRSRRSSSGVAGTGAAVDALVVALAEPGPILNATEPRSEG